MQRNQKTPKYKENGNAKNSTMYRNAKKMQRMPRV